MPEMLKMCLRNIWMVPYEDTQSIFRYHVTQLDFKSLKIG